MTPTRQLPVSPLLPGLLLLLPLAGCVEVSIETSDSRDEEERLDLAEAPLVATPVPSGTDELIQAVYPVVSEAGDQVIWASGHGGSWLRSLNGGASWTHGVVAGHEEAEFRDIHAFGPSEAVLMAAGPGEASRILVTRDDGQSWTETFVMDHPEGFLDCMMFWDADHGVAYGDAVEGGLYIIRTTDGGQSWSRTNPQALPAALEGEGGFAASGTCARTGGTDVGWIATGNGAAPRLLLTENRGESWEAEAVTLPLVAGEGRGATTVAIRPGGLGFVMGGTIGSGQQGARIALTADGGLSWSAREGYPLPGAIYGADWLGDRNGIVAVGPGGIAFSRDAGLSWEVVDTLSHWAVEFGDRRDFGFATGPGGRITRLELETGR